MEIKIKDKLKGYPRVFEITLFNEDKMDDLYLIGSPVANCQTFSVGNISSLLGLNLTDNNIKSLLLKFYKLSQYKRQMIIDVKMKDIQEIMSILSKFTTKYYKKNYTSTNESKMTLLILQLDIEKITEK